MSYTDQISSDPLVNEIVLYPTLVSGETYVSGKIEEYDVGVERARARDILDSMAHLYRKTPVTTKVYEVKTGDMLRVHDTSTGMQRTSCVQVRRVTTTNEPGKTLCVYSRTVNVPSHGFPSVYDDATSTRYKTMITINLRNRISLVWESVDPAGDTWVFYVRYGHKDNADLDVVNTELRGVIDRVHRVMSSPHSTIRSSHADTVAAVIAEWNSGTLL